jgi:hypothetical protein
MDWSDVVKPAPKYSSNYSVLAKTFVFRRKRVPWCAVASIAVRLRSVLPNRLGRAGDPNPHGG